MANQVKASDCKCCVCGGQAVAFWPVIDPDIPSHPYCRQCLDREKLKAMIATFGDERGASGSTNGTKERTRRNSNDNEFNEFNELNE